MDLHPLAKLTQAVRNFKIIKHLKRQMFLTELVGAMIKARSVIFSELADKMDRDALPSSIERRIQDFFQKVDFDYEQLLVLLICFVPHDKLVLSIDRTEWDRGKKQYNILCVMASIGKMGVPLYFEMLDNKSGNSNSQDRIRVLQRIVKTLGQDRIDYLVMDREFIGHKWLRWLKQQGVQFCVRVPKHHSILFADGQRTTAIELLDNEGIINAADVVVDQVVVNLYVGKDKNGDLLYLIGNLPARKLKAAYRKRWSIEVFFQALKGRGFCLEKSGLRSLPKMRKLFAVACIAYVICWAVAIEQAKIKPVKRKKHGYPQYSVFRRGLNLIRLAFKTASVDFIIALWKRIEAQFAELQLKTIG
jgi:hypothetical protein